jgi:hypothetical protein
MLFRSGFDEEYTIGNVLLEKSAGDVRPANFDLLDEESLGLR